MDPDFEIYRPPQISNRLEPVYSKPKTNEWRPSVGYNHSLLDIQAQFTPAEHFRYRLATSGKEIRLIQKLELRWNRHFDLFRKSAIKVQASYRGVVVRRHFRSIKGKLVADLKLKRITTEATEAFNNERYADAVTACHKSDELTVTLLTIELKSHYRLQQYEFCIKTSMQILELAPKDEEAHFLQACAWCQLQNYTQASDILQTSIALNSESSDRMFRLYAGVALNVMPPDYDSAADSYAQLLQRNPLDFESLFLRACCWHCLQEWTAALKDLEVILAFQPKDKRALLFKARIFACRREWTDAEKVFQFILLHYPKDSEALEGLQLISPAEANAGLDSNLIY